METAVAATSASLVTLIAALLVGAFVVRSALVPAWNWLPQTAEAPSPVSAYLHAGIVNGPGVLAALMWPIFRSAPIALAALLVFGAVSAVVGIAAARTRPDVKSQLACSTTSQMGYMCIQLGLGLPGVAVVHLIGHGFYKAWLFLRAGGEVTRRREIPVLAFMSKWRKVSSFTLAAVIPLAVLAAMWPFLSSLLAAFGPVAIVPFAAAGASASVAIYAATTLRRGAARRVSLPVVGATVALGAYVATIGAWDQWLSPDLPPAAVWSPVAAVSWLILLAAVSALTIMLTRMVTIRPDSDWALRLLASALPPAARNQARTQPTSVPMMAPASNEEAEHVRGLVDVASRLSAPAFPLREFIASNPVAGLETTSFELAAEITATYSARNYLGPAEYRALYDRGRITDADLLAALDSASTDRLPRLGDAQETGSDAECSVATLCDRADVESAGPRWSLAEIVDAHAALWCAHVWGDGNLRPNENPGSDGIYRRWQQACVTHSWGARSGIANADVVAERLGDDPAKALASMLGQLPADMDPFPYLCRLLTADPGWAGHASWRVREGELDALIELLAIRMALDIAVSASASASATASLTVTPSLTANLAERPSRANPDESDSLELWQRALEFGYQNRLVDSLSQRAAQPRPDADAAESTQAQLIFCIDVRSERMRRHLESTGQYKTYGFAGFFGATVRYEAPSGQCFDQYPVLLAPTCTVRSAAPLPTARYSYSAANAAGKAPLTGYALAEGGGIFTGVAGLIQILAPRAFGRAVGFVNPNAAPEGLPALASAEGHQGPGEKLPDGFGLGEQVQLAEGALRAIGLTEGFASLLVRTRTRMGPGRQCSLRRWPTVAHRVTGLGRAGIPALLRTRQ